MKKILLTSAAIVFSFANFIACKSTQIEVPTDATNREIIQMAQTAYDNGKTNQALNYYDILLKRYGMDTATYVEGKYEIAHIYVKQKKYNAAKPILEEILGIYDSVQPGVLPGSFKKLSQNDYEKVTSALQKSEQANK